MIGSGPGLVCLAYSVKKCGQLRVCSPYFTPNHKLWLLFWWNINRHPTFTMHGIQCTQQKVFKYFRIFEYLNTKYPCQYLNTGQSVPNTFSNTLPVTKVHVYAFNNCDFQPSYKVNVIQSAVANDHPYTSQGYIQEFIVGGYKFSRGCMGMGFTMKK